MLAETFDCLTSCLECNNEFVCIFSFFFLIWYAFRYPWLYIMIVHFINRFILVGFNPYYLWILCNSGETYIMHYTHTNDIAFINSLQMSSFINLMETCDVGYFICSFGGFMFFYFSSFFVWNLLWACISTLEKFFTPTKVYLKLK